jgi:hypothetical protein
MLEVYAIELVEPDIDRGDPAPWCSLTYDSPADSVEA